MAETRNAECEGGKRRASPGPCLAVALSAEARAPRSAAAAEVLPTKKPCQDGEVSTAGCGVREKQRNTAGARCCGCCALLRVTARCSALLHAAAGAFARHRRGTPCTQAHPAASSQRLEERCSSGSISAKWSRCQRRARRASLFAASSGSRWTAGEQGRVQQQQTRACEAGGQGAEACC